MKIFLAQQNYHIGNFESNTNKDNSGHRKSKITGCDLVIFSEMSVCGYPARDFVEFNDFINKCYASIDQIRQHADTIGVLIGGPAREYPAKRQKPLMPHFSLRKRSESRNS